MATQFSVEARSQFDSIAHHFGLVCTVCTDRLVQYENDRVLLRISFDSARSFEIGIEIAEREVSGPAFSLAEVLRSKGCHDPITVGGVMASNASGFHAVLSHLSELTSTHMIDLLAGHHSSFNELAGFRAKECAELALSSNLRFARRAAKAAWIKQDFHEVVNTLGPFEAHLSGAEKKQLAYSRKRLAQTDQD